MANSSDEKQPQVGSPEANAKAKKLYKTGVKYGNAGLFTQAAEVFRQVVSLKPDYFEAYRSLGHAYIDLNQEEEAVEALGERAHAEPQRQRGATAARSSPTQGLESQVMKRLSPNDLSAHKSQPT